MKTNWSLIRKLMNSAIDACETVDQLGVTEENRADTFIENEKLSATMWDYLQSSWTYPENLTYTVIRARHDLKQDKAYTNELGRTLVAVGHLCSELIDAQDMKTKVSDVDPFRMKDASSLEEMIDRLCTWYSEWMVPGVTKIMNSKNQRAEVLT